MSEQIVNRNRNLLQIAMLIVASFFLSLPFNFSNFGRILFSLFWLVLLLIVYDIAIAICISLSSVILTSLVFGLSKNRWIELNLKPIHVVISVALISLIFAVSLRKSSLCNRSINQVPVFLTTCIGSSLFLLRWPRSAIGQFAFLHGEDNAAWINSAAANINAQRECLLPVCSGNGLGSRFGLYTILKIVLVIQDPGGSTEKSLGEQALQTVVNTYALMFLLGMLLSAILAYRIYLRFSDGAESSLVAFGAAAFAYIAMEPITEVGHLSLLVSIVFAWAFATALYPIHCIISESLPRLMMGAILVIVLSIGISSGWQFWFPISIFGLVLVIKLLFTAIFSVRSLKTNLVFLLLFVCFLVIFLSEIALTVFNELGSFSFIIDLLGSKGGVIDAPLGGVLIAFLVIILMFVPSYSNIETEHRNSLTKLMMLSSPLISVAVLLFLGFFVMKFPRYLVIGLSVIVFGILFVLTSGINRRRIGNRSVTNYEGLFFASVGVLAGTIWILSILFVSSGPEYAARKALIGLTAFMFPLSLGVFPKFCVFGSSIRRFFGVACVFVGASALSYTLYPLNFPVKILVPVQPWQEVILSASEKYPNSQLLCLSPDTRVQSLAAYLCTRFGGALNGNETSLNNGNEMSLNNGNETSPNRDWRTAMVFPSSEFSIDKILANKQSVVIINLSPGLNLDNHIPTIRLLVNQGIQIICSTSSGELLDHCT